MKKFRFITMALMAMFMGSCSNEEIATPEQEAEYVTVNLGVTGEYLDLSDSPLATRTTSTLKDLIGIQVYTISDNNTETRYAWGVFTSLEGVKIKLIKNLKYKFETSIIVDGYGCTEHLGHEVGHSNTCMGFYHPSYPVGTDFTYSSDFNLPNFKYTQKAGSFGDSYKHDRFYGEMAEYTPNENGTVEIATKRTAYGTHYVAEGLTEGHLDIKVSSPSWGGVESLYTVKLTSAKLEDNSIYTFHEVKSAWDGIHYPLWDEETQTAIPAWKEYYITKQLTIKWIKDDGSETPLGTFDVTFKRNVKTKIRIKVTDPGVQNGIVITREETPMTDDDKEYVIEGGEITEVPVTTTPQ